VTPPDISVIIPAYNAERYLAQAIESVLAQRPAPAEVIVVDDGSSDGSAAVARGFGAPVRCLTQPNAGGGAARNRGVREARGAWLAFLDSDDLWSADKLALQTAALERDPALEAVFGHVEHFHSPELADEAKAATRLPPVMPGYHVGAMLIRAAAIARVGPFEEKLRRADFIGWYLRASELELRSLMLPQVLMRRRVHDANYGLVARNAAGDYVKALKASLDRRRAASGPS
jgi:glycosyltransferase involved in cell wall biosynthesis